ncbi:MAG: hypothetical protein K8I03_05280 [Ignavibacteria bacterium]|nr:hypothetical protein [Ignavibacteria bacterium]
MKQLILILTIASLMFLTSCSDVNRTSAKIFLEKNREMLDLIVQEMYIKNHYTYLNIYHRNIFDKIRLSESMNIANGRIEKSDEYFNIIIADTTVTDNNYGDLIRNYLSKLTDSLNSNEINSLEQILLWMQKNSIEVIAVKTPEFNNITILLNSDSGLRYQNREYNSRELDIMDPLGNNWYFVKYK